MRSAYGPLLLLIGIATTAVLVLLVIQNVGLRNDLEQTRGELAALRAEVALQDPGVTTIELRRELEDLESGMRDWLIATGADGFSADPGTPAAAGSGVTDRLDEILERIDDLDARIDEICGGVPVC